MNELNPEYFHPDGTRKTFDERAAYRRAIGNKKREFEKEVDKANEAARDKQPRNVFAEHLAKMDARGTPLNARDAEEWKARRKIIVRQADAREAEIEKKRKADSYATSPLVARVRDSAAAIKRSTAEFLPHATESEVIELLALAETDAMTPEDLNHIYFSKLAVLEDANVKAERLLESAAAVAAAKATADHARQQKNVAEREATLNATKSLAGGGANE